MEKNPVSFASSLFNTTQLENADTTRFAGSALSNRGTSYKRKNAHTASRSTTKFSSLEILRTAWRPLIIPFLTPKLISISKTPLSSQRLFENSPSTAYSAQGKGLENFPL
jgi:hypothetical protein